MSLACLAEAPGGVFLQVLVQPRASRNEVAGLQGEELKLRLTSPPVEGAANKLCCEYVAKLCGVAKSKVELVAGDKNRHKRLRIEGVSAAELETILRPLL